MRDQSGETKSKYQEIKINNHRNAEKIQINKITLEGISSSTQRQLQQSL